jgi:hypothetical protein
VRVQCRESRTARGRAEKRPSRGELPAGGVEVNVWKNETANGEKFNITITNSYKDHKTGEWMETTGHGPEELAILVQLSTQAFQEIVRQKTRPRSLK